MYFLQHETGRRYDGDQVLTILVRDNNSWDDRFLKHDITFRDASRGIIGAIDFETSEDRDDFFEIFTGKKSQGEYVLNLYDNGQYQIGGDQEIGQIIYYYARYA
jgi:hypothetical protein